MDPRPRRESLANRPAHRSPTVHDAPAALAASGPSGPPEPSDVPRISGHMAQHLYVSKAYRYVGHIIGVICQQGRRMLDAEHEIDRIQIGLIRALAGHQRLRIVHLLGRGPIEVRELGRMLGLSQAAVSQNLAAMRAAGLVEANRSGRLVRYRLADPEIVAACAVIRSVVVRRLSVLGDLAAAAGPAGNPILTASGTQVTNP